MGWDEDTFLILKQKLWGKYQHQFNLCFFSSYAFQETDGNEDQF